jgi:hypothetical protein
MMERFRFNPIDKEVSKGVAILLKPLDLDILIPRMFDVQRIEQTHSSRPIVSQQEISREAVKQSQERQEQVLQNEASAKGNSIHEDGDAPERNRDRRYRRYGQRKKAELNMDQTVKATDTNRGQHIDIKL